MSQMTFSDFEYSNRKKKTKREEFLDVMEDIIPWDEWVEFVRPYYPKGKRGRPTRGIEKMLRRMFQIMLSTGKKIDHRKSSVRCKVEHAFHYIKVRFKFTKVRYRGIAKNLHKLNVLFACTNLLMYAYAKKHSVQAVGYVRPFEGKNPQKPLI